MKYYKYIGTEEQRDEYGEPRPIIGKIYSEKSMVGGGEVAEFYEYDQIRDEWEEVQQAFQNKFDINTIYSSNEFGGKVCAYLDSMKSLLINKNQKYGDSALNPLRIFSKSNSKEQLLVRIDDKLSRIKNGSLDEDEDVVNDLIGYLVLLKISQ